MDEPLRFIFSHSALKEGWDNPNVFQVCTLLEQSSALTCRQKIGRGLRLCVNQGGERVYDKQINALHVIASESFADFAKGLQSEIERETGIKFGIIEVDSFMDIEIPTEMAMQLRIEILPEPEQLTLVIPEPNAPMEPANLPIWQPPTTVKLGYDGSKKLVEMLKAQGAIDTNGKIKKETREAVEQGTLQ